MEMHGIRGSVRLAPQFEMRCNDVRAMVGSWRRSFQHLTCIQHREDVHKDEEVASNHPRGLLSLPTPQLLQHEEKDDVDTAGTGTARQSLPRNI